MEAEKTPKQNRTVAITALPEFPPTVVDHESYSDGADLILLDPGDREEPRFIRVVDGQSAQFIDGSVEPEGEEVGL